MVIVHMWEKLNETFEARASEWMLAGITASAGVLGLLNPEFLHTSAFSRILLLASADAWIWAFLLIGIGRWAVLLVNGMYWRTPHLRSAFAFFTCFIWFFMAIGLAANLSLELAIFPWLFLLDAYNSLRAGREAGIAEFLRKHRRRTSSDERLARQSKS